MAVRGDAMALCFVDMLFELCAVWLPGSTGTALETATECSDFDSAL